MVASSRKQREIQDREAQILELARPILLREGYAALSMDRLAGLMEYAKGTLYNHFPNKEEIVLALAIQSMELRFQMFEVASMTCSESRRRLIGVGAACEFYSRSCRDHFAIEEWIRNSTIWGKASPRRHEIIRQCESRCMGVVTGVVRDAIAHGDLKLPSGISPEEMIFGFWAINYGSQVLAATSPSLSSLGVPDAAQAIRHHCHTLLNGFAWQPIMDFQEHAAWMDSVGEQLKGQFENRI